MVNWFCPLLKGLGCGGVALIEGNLAPNASFRDNSENLHYIQGQCKISITRDSLIHIDG